MQTSHFWHKLYLYGTKAIIIFLFCFTAFSETVQAQKKTWNLRDYELKSLHYGFQIGMQSNRLLLRPSEVFNNNLDSTVAIMPRRSSGAFIGFLIDLPIDEEFWNVRINPGVSFYEHRVKYEYSTGESTEQTVESAFFDLPVLLKYKSLRRGNTRMYMIGGASLGIKVGNRKEKLDPEKLSIDDTNVELVYGVGFDFYLPFFKFAPEIRFAHGLNNVLYAKPNSVTRNLERITTHRVSLFLNFE
ncbi:MAG: PorT family protein [Cytophagales bacterium]|nr:MAG: PorT family protein [Cytophagales bacterium]TAF60752.1 MAG: PorT family protein [Cytophagales bacterium]